MISLATMLEGRPVKIKQDVFFYQPSISDIVNMGETTYWAIVNLWMLKRQDMIQQETPMTETMDDYTLWKTCIIGNKSVRRTFILSCEWLLKSKVEFFDVSGTIYIGETSSGVILDETFYLIMKELCSRITPQQSASIEEGQYHETDNMSERERQMIEKMKAAEQKIEQTKNPDKKPEDYLGNRILGLVAVGGYTFEQVYNMTMLQFNMLLQKYVDIQTFELRTSLSPYISSDEGQTNKFWLD